MKVQVNTEKVLGAYTDPTQWQNSTLRYVPPVDFPRFLASRLGKAKIMRTWITLDEYWDYRTGTTYPDYEIGKLRYPVEQLHYPYDMASIVPAPSGTRFRDYLITHSQNAQALLLNVRRYEREVSDGVISYDQYEALFENAVEYCKSLAPNIRYVECCNEVDITAFGLLTAEEYVAIYLRAYQAVKRLNERHNYAIPLELGGFGQAHPLQSWALRTRIMELLKESPIGDDPMAFYAYHMYNAPENRSLTNAGMFSLTRLSGIEKLKKILQQHHELMEKLDLPQRPVFLDEIGRARATGMDGDSAHNAAGLLTYMIAFCKGDLGQAYPFPWCSFHNPKLQMSYTQYLLREDGSYGATPNGIAMEMLHSLSGDLLAVSVNDTPCPDAMYCALAVKDADGFAVLATNPTWDSMPCELELNGLEDGQYRVEIYSCNLVKNNIVYHKGTGTGKLEKTEEKTVKVQNGRLYHWELFDKDCFSLTRFYKI